MNSNRRKLSKVFSTKSADVSSKRVLQRGNGGGNSPCPSRSFYHTLQIRLPQQEMKQLPFPPHEGFLLLTRYLRCSFEMTIQPRLNLGELLLFGTQSVPLLLEGRFDCEWMRWEVARDVGVEGDSVDGVG